jgi:hypothetical protein
VDFQLKFKIPEAPKKITFSDNLIFIGSCFSDEMSLNAKQHGFHVCANPFGTLFHPLALAQNVLDALHEKSEVNIVRNEDVFMDYSCSGKVYGMNEDELIEKIRMLRNEFKNQLKNASYLFVTLGTAFAYSLNGSTKVVGNCHKQPSQFFTKKLTSNEEITSTWKVVISELKRFNPSLQVCFTVSPVRHVKDGLHENNVSKSTLILAINQLWLENEISYFPAFELVNDVLRDYRFFKEDLVHPNQQAVQFVWENFMETFLENETIDIAKQVNEIKNAMSHRLQYPKSSMAGKFQSHILERKLKLEKENPRIFWE